MPSSDNFWKKLWTLKLPGKIINFVWRACNACLPTAVALLHKRVQIDAKCPWCRVANEDDVHVLFQCQFARSLWETTGYQDLVMVCTNDRVIDVFKRIFTRGTKEQIVLVALFCWNLWNRRNRWVWDKVNMSVFGTRTAAINLLTDWKKAQMEVNKYKSVLTSSSKKWKRPTQGWIKVNIDAARFEDISSIGVGGIIRDDQGRFVGARSRRIGAFYQPREAEAVSLKEALSWVKELGFQQCIFETDAKQVVDAFYGGQGRSYFHTIVQECVEFSKHFDNVLLEFVNRSANGVAHVLARATHSMSEALIYDSV